MKVDINDYKEVRETEYKNERYLARDNGAILRLPKNPDKPRKMDNIWTWGKVGTRGYLSISNEMVHRIVAFAFLGEPKDKNLIVDHIDTNRMNNRPSNLRWVTKLENVLLNDITRLKIEHDTGVSIYEFIENPAKYRDLLKDPNITWMKPLTEEESLISKDKMKAWILKKKEDRTKLIYDKSYGDPYEFEYNVRNSRTPNSMQVNWFTPVEFINAPKEAHDNPILEYYNNLGVDKVFYKSDYGEFKILDLALINNDKTILVITLINGVKSFAIARITYNGKYYMHESLGTFFTEEGARKEFTIIQGKEWTGGNTFDDYC